MDASKYITAVGHEGAKIDDIAARRMAVANALRDLADEIESGARRVNEMQTFERVAANQSPTSILHMVTYMVKLPSDRRAKP